MSLLSNLSGKELYWSILSGGKRIIEHQDEINKINVFPVPDGDTGSNLAATASSIIYHSQENDCVKQVADSIGDAALDGARGNSGVIFAQFLYAMGQEIKDSSAITLQKFADIVKNASKYVYSAIPSPKEGTIITVIREWAEYIHTNHQNFSDFETMLSKAKDVANTALLKTTEQLEALKIAKVVDAGAKGFVLFIEGMYETLKNRAFSREDHDMDHLLMADYDLPMAEAESLTEESLHYRFCTETCLIGENISRDDVLKELEADSDSIVIAGSTQKLRLHFHTNHPADMFDKLRKFGSFSFQKVEDMRLQYNITHHRKSNIAFVIDTGSTVSQEFLDEHHIYIVPTIVEVNNSSYQDIRTMTLDIFKKYASDKKSTIKTSQPSPKSFADTFGYLSNYYDSIIVLTMSSGISGTYNSALQGKQLVQSKKDIKIDIIDSKQLAAGCTSLAYIIADEISQGISHDEIVKNVTEKYVKKTENFINLNTIDHLIKSGRLGLFKGGIIKLLNLSPVLKVENGKPVISGKAFGFAKALKKNLANIKNCAEKYSKIKCYSLTHADLDEKTLNNYINSLTNTLGIPPRSVDIAGPSIANHVGIGAVCVALTFE